VRLALRIVCVSLPTWAIRLAVFLPLAVIGIPLVYVLAHAGWCEPRLSKRFERTTLQWRTPWLLGLWSNEEDGIDGLRGGDPNQDWWAEKTKNLSPQMRIWKWAALRNPVDNLRFVPILNPRIEPSKVHFVGLDHEPAEGEGGWYFAWQGLYSCIRYETKQFRIWLGWKIKPEDRLGLALDDPRAIRCDFAIQAKRIA